ncbi:MAG TPA: N-acetylmuramoyl-L-alanine amidase [Spirochaetota bacterium]|nr:N-acetylmuramoyl-L-alanine amidase [Spirochaetota bacterium]
MIKKTIFSILAIVCIFPSAILNADSNDNPYNPGDQPAIIRKVITMERSIRHSKGLYSIVSKLDNMYANLYDKIRDGKKIRIYIDPAHGKLHGTWRGLLSGRYCVLGNSEEYYSILMLRELYKHLSNNSHIEIITPEDHLKAMKGECDSYNDITFKESIRKAFETNCQIIISQHLNNVAMCHKATGTSNISGVHIIHGGRGRKYLANITSIYKGFLTLYNKLDVSGFSRKYAYNLRSSLIDCGLTPNNWERGAVADDRFEYFVDFPISIIYESGFISNPDDLNIIQNQESRKKIAAAQYETLIRSLKKIFCVDISGSTVKKCDSDQSMYDLTLLKLSRMSLYYLRHGKPRKACTIIDIMNRHYGKTRFKSLIEPYLHMKNRALQAERYYSKAKYYIKKPARNRRAKRRYIREAKRYLHAAKNIARTKPYYYGLYRRYNRTYKSLFPKRRRSTARIANNNSNRNIEKSVPRYIPCYEKVVQAPVARPVIFVVNSENDIADAIQKAFEADSATHAKLMKSFKNASTVKWVKKRKWSRKRRRRITYWKKINEKISFTCGIYIVTLHNNLTIKSAKKVPRVTLDDNRYQNQLYLKNSHFAHVHRDKSL